jgi:hypothetical protein
MLTKSQMHYLHSRRIPFTVVNGTSIKGGDDQYTAYLIDPNAVTNFKAWIKDEISSQVDEKLESKYPRSTNKRYRAKHMEALAFKNSGYLGSADDYQFLKEEALERGITMTQMADLIITAANTYNANVAAVERRRVKFNNDVDAATTLDDVHALWDAARLAIEAL